MKIERFEDEERRAGSPLRSDKSNRTGSFMEMAVASRAIKFRRKAADRSPFVKGDVGGFSGGFKSPPTPLYKGGSM